ncbi:MAG: methyltransferase [Betaproteobacteria bacterium]|nr:methyltransferase [Betaproteobacteria bacterium]
MTDLEAHFAALGALLAAQDDLWRPAPFHTPRPAWCEALPGLSERLLALPEAEAARLADDAQGLIDLLAAWRPELAALHGLIALAQSAALPDAPPERLLAHVPGRKQAQITAFSAAVGEVRHPLLEWCAGKGHLGRLLAWRQPHPVASLEIDGALVEAGIDLARHAGLAQNFLQGDALAAASAHHLAGRHAVALHACGDLHLALLRGAAAQGAPALDLAPCCYYRIAQPEYAPLNPDAGLRLTRDELHLAVTESVTAGARERRLRDRARAWKLAFLELRAAAGGARTRTFKPAPGAWLALGFAGWITRMAAREGVVLPPAPDWAALEAAGWRRLREVARLELVRLAFRRPLEVWLALDRAVFLERSGYHVAVRTFCDRRMTPRNVLISARKKPG